MKTLPRVLVVDDDPVIGKSFNRVLSNKGYAVITASDGEEALRKLDSEHYDLVFTDIKMPGMDGLEVTQRIKANQPWMPVVIITGYGTEENVTQAGEAGVAAFLRKPLTPDMIEDSVKMALLKTKDSAPEPTAPEQAAAVESVDSKHEISGIMLFARNVAMFIAAPFIGLAYALAFPFIGLGLLTWMGAKAMMKLRLIRTITSFIVQVAKFAAAPFVGLAYVLLFPVIGLGLLTFYGARAILQR
jgi:CheY-like chemotaxis protein